MAYALVAWRGGGEELALEAELADLPTVPFFRGLFLVREDGPGWNAVKERVQDAVEANPGMEAVIVMPGKGTRVGGWVDTAPSAGDLQAARDIMNRAGSTAVPVFYATPRRTDADEED